MFTNRDTSNLLEADIEAQQPQMLVLRPAAVAEAGPPRPGADSSFRLRLMFLIGVASLALVTIVVISQQLIVRHLAGRGEQAVVLRLDIPAAALIQSGVYIYI